MRALLWEFITIGASKSVLKAMLDAILSRHRDAGLPSPLAGNMTYSQLFNCVGRLLGKQQKHKFPITRQMVCDALRLRPTTPSQFRNKMILVVGTMGIMRPGEITAPVSVTPCHGRAASLSPRPPIYTYGQGCGCTVPDSSYSAGHEPGSRPAHRQPYP